MGFVSGADRLWKLCEWGDGECQKRILFSIRMCIVRARAAKLSKNFLKQTLSPHFFQYFFTGRMGKVGFSQVVRWEKLCIVMRTKDSVRSFSTGNLEDKKKKRIFAKKERQHIMTTLTLNIADQSVMPMLLNAIKEFKGVTIAQNPVRMQKTRTAHNPLAADRAEETQKADGEKWAREVLVPTYLDVLDKEKKGIELPDAYDFLRELEELDKLEACK